MNRDTFGTRVKTGRLAALLALACALTCSLPAAAQAGMQYGFTLNINARERILTTPNNQGVVDYATWIPRSQMKLALRSPTLMLTNDPESAGPITEFRMTIGDTRFHFDNTLTMFHGEYAIPGISNPDAILSSYVEDDEDELVVTFGEGLMQGESICIRISIDEDADHPEVVTRELDYKNVLFDKNGIQAFDGFEVDFDNSDNAMATVTFGPLESPLEVVKAILPDTMVSESESSYYFDALRYHSSMMTATTVSFVPSEEPVPEPTSMTLALLAGLGGAVLAARRRRCR